MGSGQSPGQGSRPSGLHLSLLSDKQGLWVAAAASSQEQATSEVPTPAMGQADFPAVLVTRLHPHHPSPRAGDPQQAPTATSAITLQTGQRCKATGAREIHVTFAPGSSERHGLDKEAERPLGPGPMTLRPRISCLRKAVEGSQVPFTSWGQAVPRGPTDHSSRRPGSRDTSAPFSKHWILANSNQAQDPGPHPLACPCSAAAYHKDLSNGHSPDVTLVCLIDGHRDLLADTQDGSISDLTVDIQDGGISDLTVDTQDGGISDLIDSQADGISDLVNDQGGGSSDTMAEDQDGDCSNLLVDSQDATFSEPMAGSLDNECRDGSYLVDIQDGSILDTQDGRFQDTQNGSILDTEDGRFLNTQVDSCLVDIQEGSFQETQDGSIFDTQDGSFLVDIQDGGFLDIQDGGLRQGLTDIQGPKEEMWGRLDFDKPGNTSKLLSVAEAITGRSDQPSTQKGMGVELDLGSAPALGPRARTDDLQDAYTEMHQDMFYKAFLFYRFMRLGDPLCRARRQHQQRQHPEVLGSPRGAAP
ncbi:uncharacterized protein [Narcine bancroftii]|uniref:uncharacterized protein n=1 Tax=Narcine bancroftii TaxID=1343680 RepID=UPI0038318E20